MTHRSMLFALLTLGLFGGAAMAQDAPGIFLDNIRRQQGNELRFCVDDAAVGAPFDRAVAQAIGDALLISVVFDRSPGGFPISGGGYFEELQIRLNKNCDVVMGMSLQSGNPYPEWVTPTRPYATVPFVMAVIDPDYRGLSDIPRDRMIGTALGSAGEWAFIGTMQQRQKDARWKRLPYADRGLMLRRLRDGSLAGMLLWQPTLGKLLANDPEADTVRVIPSDPVPQTYVRVGALLSSRDTYLRSQIDAAIGELIDDGTIAGLMAEMGYEGQPGG